MLSYGAYKCIIYPAVCPLNANLDFTHFLHLINVISRHSLQRVLSLAHFPEGHVICRCFGFVVGLVRRRQRRLRPLGNKALCVCFTLGGASLKNPLLWSFSWVCLDGVRITVQTDGHFPIGAICYCSFVQCVEIFWILWHKSPSTFINMQLPSSYPSDSLSVNGQTTFHWAVV